MYSLKLLVKANHNSQLSIFNSQLTNSQFSIEYYLQFFKSCIVLIGSAALNM